MSKGKDIFNILFSHLEQDISRKDSVAIYTDDVLSIIGSITGFASREIQKKS